MPFDAARLLSLDRTIRECRQRIISTCFVQQ